MTVPSDDPSPQHLVAMHVTSADSLMVMIPAFQAGGPGSIPGRRIMYSPPFHAQWLYNPMGLSAPNCNAIRYRGVVVITSA